MTAMYNAEKLVDFFAIHAGHPVTVDTKLGDERMVIDITVSCSQCNASAFFRYFDGSRYEAWLKSKSFTTRRDHQ